MDNENVNNQLNLVEDEDENARRIREINLQSLQTQQAINDLRMLIADLRERPICAPRRIQHGAMRRENGGRLHCAFCNADGQHQSDSCPQVRDGESRRQILDSERRCHTCFAVLRIACPGDRRCRRWANPCYHCRAYGHHSAICELPDRSDVVMWRRLQRAREALRSAEARLERLRGDLRILL
ncbi:unnamed protein product [Cylicostephanus goldi]|uniref:CCHC-type domain-containing protein n=1 Tax=Cylicostephanus goldi TaxID=71465 RepID=A0A3P6PYD3_CYLGO|nr:unnamed protein product [Cylicostephanus goldi]